MERSFLDERDNFSYDTTEMRYPEFSPLSTRYKPAIIIAVKNIYVPMRDATGHAFHNSRPDSETFKYLGSVKIENSETHQTELCDIWGDGDLSSAEGFSLIIMSERSTTKYNIKAGLGVDNSYTISYTILDSNHFSGNMYEEIEELRRMLKEIKILV
ncbi:MAG: hypothetical protein J5861_01000 [Desulfovibrio sp.]|nr:hypothetical protein [Desulfovibrio sp.]